MVWPFALVERDEAVRRRGRLAPAEHQAADDHAVAVDDRRRHPAAVGRPHPVLFGQRALPQQLAVLVERHRQAVAADREDVAGARIDDRRRPGDAVRRHVAGEQVVAVFPEQLAGVGVEAHQRAPAPSRRRRRCSAGRAGRRTRPARTARRTAPATPGSRRPATRRSRGPVSVETPVRAGPRQSGQSAPRRSATAGSQQRNRHRASRRREEEAAIDPQE